MDTKVADQARVVSLVPVCVTTNADQTRARLRDEFAVVGRLPSYRAVLDREGATTPDDAAVISDVTSVEHQLRRYTETGATELVGVPAGTPEEQRRTIDLLAHLNNE